MGKVIVDKEKCREVALEMKHFSFEHPQEKEEIKDKESYFFYLFIVVGICHQINWNFLMKALENVSVNYPLKFNPSYMKNVGDDEVYDWLSDYPKKWRLEKRFKRAHFIRNMSAVLVSKYKGKLNNLLEASKNKMSGENGLYNLLKDFEAYGEDPLCKKSALFIDLIDRFGLWEFNDWHSYIPPVDYQIARVALRNGVVSVKDSDLFKKLVKESPASQDDDVVIRSTIIDALREMSSISNKKIKNLQGFYWVLGRECCDPDNPHCFGCNNSQCRASEYMNVFCNSKCPLADVCEAVRNKELLNLKEHNFETTFY